MLNKTAARFALSLLFRVKKRKRCVVLVKKYFHHVAIILLAPISWLDPEMISLSYAIAIALMVTLEMIRCCMPLEKVSHYAQGHRENKAVFDFV